MKLWPVPPLRDPGIYFFVSGLGVLLSAGRYPVLVSGPPVGVPEPRTPEESFLPQPAKVAAREKISAARPNCERENFMVMSDRLARFCRVSESCGISSDLEIERVTNWSAPHRFEGSLDGRIESVHEPFG